MMDTNKSLQAARDMLAPWAKEMTTPEPNRLDVVIEAENLVPLITELAVARWGYLSAITGLDLGVELGAFEVLYHFCAGAAIVTLRVRLPRNSPSVPSICGVLPNASVFERELSEMFGVTVVGTPIPDRLFLPDDWPDDIHPLRKDFAAQEVKQ
jgi:Ni,Fe-hydrogenase III component G